MLALIVAAPEWRGFIFSAELTPSSGGPYLRLADIEITLSYPGYTKIPAATLRDGTGDIEALKGTKVRFEAKPLDRLGTGRLTTDGGASYPVVIKDGKLTAEFPVLGNGSYRITDGGGLETRPFKITASEDKKPDIKISSPEGTEIESGPDGRVVGGVTDAEIQALRAHETRLVVLPGLLREMSDEHALLLQLAGSAQGCWYCITSPGGLNVKA